HPHGHPDLQTQSGDASFDRPREPTTGEAIVGRGVPVIKADSLCMLSDSHAGPSGTVFQSQTGKRRLRRPIPARSAKGGWRRHRLEFRLELGMALQALGVRQVVPDAPVAFLLEALDEP